MRKIYLLMAICLAAVNITHADTGILTETQTAATFTENTLKPALNKILTISKTPEADRDEKTVIYDKIIASLFDYSLASKLTLGKEQWGKLTGDQKEKFATLYGKRLQQFYLNRLLLLYPDTEISFLDTIQEQNKADVITVMKSSLLVKKNRDVEYKIRYSDEKWAIYDVEIAGISILKNYREQFSHLLSQGSMEDLLISLEKPQ